MKGYGFRRRRLSGGSEGRPTLPVPPPVSHAREKHAGHRVGSFLASQGCLQASHLQAHTVTRRCIFTRSNIGIRLPKSKLDKMAARCHILPMKNATAAILSRGSNDVILRVQRTDEHTSACDPSSIYSCCDECLRKAKAARR